MNGAPDEYFALQNLAWAARQVGISILNDRAKSYAEPFSIKITKFDGTTATISNH